MQLVLPDGRQGRILAAGLTIMLLAVLWFGMAAPLIGWYHARGEALEQRRALLGRMQELAESLPALEHQQGSARPEATALLPGASDALAAAAMQSAVQAMASASGLELASMETLPAEARGTYRRIGLRVSVAAPWPVLIQLLRAARQGQPHMLIDDVQLHFVPSLRTKGPQLMNATFTLLAFRPATEGGS
jgi:hypothetical protein